MTSTISIRIDAGKKREAELLFASLGLSLSSAVNLFIAKALDFQGIPFPVRREPPRARTPSAKRSSGFGKAFPGGPR